MYAFMFYMSISLHVHYYAFYQFCCILPQEYLARLESIRRQNYLERKKIKERVRAPQLATPIKQEEHQQTPAHHFDVESRRKKIAALKVHVHAIIYNVY